MALVDTLDNVQNQLRQHSGKIIGTEFQPMLELIKAEIKNEIKPEPLIQPLFNLFFEKLAYEVNGKGKYPGLAFLLAVVELKKAGKEEILKPIGKYCKNVVNELTPRHWEHDSIALGCLQKIINACRDGQSFLNPKIATTYIYEIKESRLTEEEKKTLVEFIKTVK